MPKKVIEIQDESELRIPSRLPVLPLRDMVIFPHIVTPLVVGRAGTLSAVEDALKTDRLIALITQKDAAVEDPTPHDLFRVGVIARVSQMMKLPNGLAKILIEGLERFRVIRFHQVGSQIQASITVLTDGGDTTPPIEAAHRHLVGLFKEFVSLNRQIPDEVGITADAIKSSRRLADIVVMHLNRTTQQKQEMLEMVEIYDLMVALCGELQREIEILTLEQTIEGKVREKISKSQRNYYLQEQLRAIKKELGEEGEDDLSDVIDYRKKVKRAKMTKEAKEKANEEIKRLEATPMLSPEATVIRTYLDWLIGVPWYKTTEDNRDIEAAKLILDEDHYGLEKPKERILEHLAVLALAGKMKGPILCLIGPPGVGKTSLGKSVARALNRQFVRVSLGGVRDEAEIRGHRKTYIGAMPGRIIQSMKKAGTVNPVFLLDEIDKMSTDFRGDPSAALLEVLDSEHNHTFSDHYLEVDYNLSQVLFILTANSRDGIPWPLQDRMEIIELPGYLHQEKFEIARRFLLKKQMAECGLKEGDVTLSDDAINQTIERYTREAGVRSLERAIAKLLRKTARELMEKKSGKRPIKIDAKKASAFLGVAPFDEPAVDGVDKIGAAVGLAWTSSGGDVLLIEAETMRGKGSLTLTGHLGEVMQESARTALTAVRARAEKLGFDPDIFMKMEIHVHIPEGAVPKDGPSAGITMATALASALSRKPVKGNIAMTGEITLRGDVLPIGGLREKLMAALRAGVKTVLIPERNKRELSEVPEAVRKPLKIIPVKTVDEVFDLMLVGQKAEAVRPRGSASPRRSAVKRV